MTTEQTELQDLVSFSETVRALIAEDPPLSRNKHNVVVCLGKAVPDEVDRLTHEVQPNAFIYYVTPPDQESAVLDQITARNPRFFTSRIDDADTLNRIGILMSLVPRRFVGTIVSSALHEPFSAEWQQIVDTIEAGVSRGTMHEQAELVFLRAGILNLPAIVKRHVAFPKLQNPNTAAVICCAGPSITEQIPMLADYHDAVLIIALRRVVPKLLEHGIKPDIAVDVDSSSMVRLSGGGQLQDTLLVASVAAAPAVAEQFPAIHWLQCNAPACRGIMKELGVWSILGSLNQSMSAAITAIDLVAQLGIHHAALIGSDLCLGEAGNMHASGMSSGQAQEQVILPGTDGTDVVSTVPFLRIKQAIEEQIAEVPTTTIHNCTQRGARIDHCKRSSLLDFLQAHSSPNVGICPLETVEKTAELEPVLSSLDAAIEHHKHAVSSIRALQREVSGSARADRLQGLNAQMVQALESQDRHCNASPSMELLSTLHDQAQCLTRINPLPPPQEDDAAGLLQNLWLKERTRLLLTEEIRADLALIQGDLSDDEESRKTRKERALLDGHREFNTFRETTCLQIQRTNPELAKAIEDGRHWPEEDEFRIVPDYINLPGLRWRDQLLVDYTNAAELASAEVDGFLNSNGVSHGDAVLVLAPGNWAVVRALLEQMPELPLFVVDPWPWVLSWLASHTFLPFFLHKQTTIIAAHDSFKRWKKVLEKSLRTHKRTSRPIYLICPQSSKLVSGIDELEETVRALLR